MKQDFSIWKVSHHGHGSEEELEIQGLGKPFSVRFPKKSLQKKPLPMGQQGHRCMVRGNKFYIQHPDEQKALCVDGAQILHRPG